MNAEFFLESLRAQLSPSATSLPHFITEKIYLNGAKFSFKGHEYQKYLTELITDNQGCTFAIVKPSQIGVTTWAIALLLSRMALIPGESIIYAMPSAQFSGEIMKTRISPMIEGSPILNSLIDKDADSTTVKRFGNGSILYALGAGPQSNTTLQSRPASAIVSDELDKCDIAKVTGFRSRLSHTPIEKRMVLMFSTPTVSDFGIDAQFKQASIQHTAVIKCNNCSHKFDPDYYTDVIIPGYTEPLATLNRAKAAKLDLSKAYLKCPECSEHLTYKNTELLFNRTVNPEGVAKKLGIKLSPFSSMAFVTPADLVESSLIYTDQAEFVNQALGKTISTKDSSITLEDLHFTAPDMELSGFNGLRVTGIDMGKLCHIISGRVKGDLTVTIDQVHVVKLADFEEFIVKLFKDFPPAAVVMDAQPYTSIVYNLVKKYPRLFSCIYTDPTTQTPELFKISQTDKYGELTRQIAVNKNKIMTQLADSLSDFFTFQTTDTVSQSSNLLISHILSMRKMRDYRYEDPLMKKWVKATDGQDHLWHSLVYLYLASKLALGNVAGTQGGVPVQVHKFKHTENAGRRDSQHTAGYGRTNL